MGSFPETYDDLQCREILQLSVWGVGGGGGHVSAPHHTNDRKMSRFCGAIPSLVFKVSPLKFKCPFFKALF